MAMKMRLVLQGRASDVRALVALALENGVLQSSEVLDDPVVAVAPARRRASGRRGPSVDFPVGTVVKVRDLHVEYPSAAPVGRQGRVVRSKRAGKGYATTVCWMSEPDVEYDVASSVLQRVAP